MVYAVVSFSIFLVQIIVPVNALGEKEYPLEKLPVVISIERLKGNGIVVQIESLPGKELRLKSNLAHILDYVFLGFPTQGALEFRDAEGKQILLRGQHPDGWWFPERLSSSVDLEKIKNLGEMSDITVSEKNVMRYPLECGTAIRSAMLNGLIEKNASVKEFRLRLQFAVSAESVEKVSVTVISEWFPVADYVK